MRGALHILRIVLRPVGYLAFVVALAALSIAARVLGDRDELGYFTDRLARTISPYDPLTTTPWDEAALAAFAMAVLWRRIVGGHRAEH